MEILNCSHGAPQKYLVIKESILRRLSIGNKPIPHKRLTMGFHTREMIDLITNKLITEWNFDYLLIKK